MMEEIKLNLENPRQLEKMYRENKSEFKSAFSRLYPDIQDQAVARAWYERLHFEADEISWGARGELLVVLAAVFIAGFIAKLPDMTGMDPEYFYPRHLAFILFPVLTAYFAWKQQMHFRHLMAPLALTIAGVVYMNLLPDNRNSDTLFLACIHMPLLMWSLLGFTFARNRFTQLERRIDYLRYNGDLVVMTTIIVISGFLLFAVTYGLFELIGIGVERFYESYVVIWGLPAAPIIGTYLVQTNPQLVNKVSPVIAKVFTPLVLVTLTTYLAAVIATGKDPYNDREFLLIFNLLLIGVMAIILFAITGTSKSRAGTFTYAMLLSLSLVTIIVNGIALSAILFRISEWGITPNRLAVLGGNILILVNLLLVAYRLFRLVNKKDSPESVELTIAAYLPVYVAWTLLVTLVFPVMFGFK